MPKQLFENAPYAEPPDETTVNLRAYFDAMPKEKIAQYQTRWSDEEVIAWDGEFRDDGTLMMVCCDRDVEIEEYRRTLEEFLEFRGKSAGATKPG